MELLEIILKGFGIVMIMMTLIWVVSVKITNASIIDPFWSIGFLVLTLWYATANANWSAYSLVLIVMVVIWSLRLFGFLYNRNKGKAEDHRYQKFRQDYGPERYWWFSFFQVFLLQAVLMIIVSLPLASIMYYGQETSIGIVEYVGIGIFLIGFLFETIGDSQMSSFKSNNLNKGKVLNKGLWKYTRHPNYFGETLVWWGIGIFSLGNNVYWPLIGSAFMMFLLLKVSGVALLERALVVTKPQYKEYVETTPSFFPWVPKNLKNK